MADSHQPGTRVVYRCHGCEYEFGVGTAGATPCPRCGSIGGHERVGTTADRSDRAGGDGPTET